MWNEKLENPSHLAFSKLLFFYGKPEEFSSLPIKVLKLKVFHCLSVPTRRKVQSLEGTNEWDGQKKQNWKCRVHPPYSGLPVSSVSVQPINLKVAAWMIIQSIKIQKAFATRHCMEDGTWYFNLQENRTWSNYSSCGLSRHSPFNTTLFEVYCYYIHGFSRCNILCCALNQLFRPGCQLSEGYHKSVMESLLAPYLSPSLF